MKVAVPVSARPGWKVSRSKWLFVREQRTVTATDEIITAFRDGQVTLRSNRRMEGFTNALQEIGYQGIRKGDLVIHSMDGFAGAIGVSDSDGKASPVVNAYSPREGGEPRYYAYVLRELARSGFITSLAKGIRERSTAFDNEMFRSLMLPSPPLDEQRAIADYLDAETARIDALIEKKQRIGELLDERGRIEAVRLVTGQRADVDLAEVDSDVYGVVPGGWRSTALRHLGCTVQTGPFGSQLHADEYVEGGWPVVNPMNLVDGGISPSDSMTVSDEKRAELARHILRKGDIVFGRRGEMGRAGIVTEMSAGWLCGTGSLRLRLHGDDLDPRYLQLLLGTPPARAYFELASVGTTMDNLNSEIVLAFPCLVPPCDEQSAIVEEVNKSRCRISQTRAVLARQIALLNERRQALITTAVTGKLDQEEFVA